MKQVISFLMVVTVILGVSLGASAITFEGDASYLLGLESTNGSGFAAHAKAEIISQVFVDGSFLTASVAKAEEAENSPRHHMLTAGALYRPVLDPDLHVFVGAGYVQLTVKEENEVKGQGIYGKFGVKIMPLPKWALVADVIFTPRYKIDGNIGSLSSSRATLSYEVFADFEVQATIKHYKSSQAGAVKNTLIGGGLSFSF